MWFWLYFLATVFYVLFSERSHYLIHKTSGDLGIDDISRLVLSSLLLFSLPQFDYFPSLPPVWGLEQGELGCEIPESQFLGAGMQDWMELEILISSSDRTKFPAVSSTRSLTPAFFGISHLVWVTFCPKSISESKLKTFPHNRKVCSSRYN